MSCRDAEDIDRCAAQWYWRLTRDGAAEGTCQEVLELAAAWLNADRRRLLAFLRIHVASTMADLLRGRAH